MGNQQERSILSNDALGGLFVGEGSYGLYIVRQPKHVEVKPGFSLRMNDLETMDLVGETFEFKGLPYYRSTKLYANCATIQVFGIKRMKKHLDVFLPHLFGRKLQSAGLVSQFVERRIGYTGRQCREYDEQDISLIEQLREINGPSVRRLSVEILRDYTLRVRRNKKSEL